MSAENKIRPILDLASESAGIKDYHWMFHRATEENPKLHPLIRRMAAAVNVFNGFELPLYMRFLREGKDFKTFDQVSKEGEYARLGAVHTALVLREATTFLVSAGALIAVFSNTGNLLLASGAHLISRFILNGILHTEMNLTFNK